MTKLLLSLHVLAALLARGPVTVAASMFPAALRRALAGLDDADGAAGSADTPGAGVRTLRTLHHICRGYAGVGIAVPLFGFATAGSLGVLGDTWLLVSILLTAAAAGLLALVLLPAQDGALAAVRRPGTTAPAPRRLAMLTGLFNLLWATVTVLMIVRPGATTGA